MKKKVLLALLVMFSLSGLARELEAVTAVPPNVILADRTTQYYQQENANHYSDNMTMTCVVVDGKGVMGNIELAAFDSDGELRGTCLSRAAQGNRAFLTIQGESRGAELHFKVVSGSETAPVISDAINLVTFVAGSVKGNPTTPYVIKFRDLDHDGDVDISDLCLLIEVMNSGNTYYNMDDFEEMLSLILAF